VKTINRRQLSHELARVLDEVIETREPVRVAGRDGNAVVIAPDEAPKETEWERINRLGLIQKAKGKFDAEFWERWNKLPAIDVDADWLLAEMESDY